MNFLRNALVVFALFAIPSVVLTFAYVGDNPLKLVALPVAPFTAVVLAIKVYVSYSLDDVHAFYLSFLVVAGFCSLLGIVHARRAALAKAVALVVGIVNALMIPMLARYFAT